MFKIFQALDDPVGLLRTHYIYSLVFSKLGDFSRAIEHALKRLEYARQSDDHTEIGHALVKIGDFCSASGDIGRAAAFFEEALEISRYTETPMIEVQSYLGLAVAHYRQGQYVDGLAPGLAGLEQAKRIDARYDVAILLGVLGNLYCNLEQYDSAMHYHEEKLRLVEQLNQDYLRAYTLRDIGCVYLGQGRVDDAIRYIEDALVYADKHGYREAQYRGYKTLADAYKAHGDFEQALAAYERYHEIRETIFNEQADRHREYLLVVHETERARAEADLQRQLREQDRVYFERLAQMKDDVLGHVSHDLKNPLTSINASLYLIRKHGRMDDETGERHLNNIEAQTRNMTDLIRQILDLARLEAQRALTLQAVDLNAYLKGIIKEQKPLADTKRISLAFVADTQRNVAHCDPVLIHQVMENLISNAIKYTPDGGKVTVACTNTGDEVVLQVSDTGIGIPEEDLSFIFERFYRVEDEQHRRVEGSGLGLAIVKSIVEQHGGQVTVSSTIGQGSTFAFALPAYRAVSQAG